MESKHYSLLFLCLLVISCANRPVEYTDDNCYGYDSRSVDCIKTVFEKNEDKFYKLYSKELRYAPEIRGKIVLLNIHLSTTGKVDKIIVKNSEIESPVLIKGMLKLVKGFNFFEGNEYSFHYPMVLDIQKN